MRMILLSVFALAGACAAPEAADDLGSDPATSLDSASPEPSLETMHESPPEPPNPDKQPKQPTYRITAEGVAGLPGADGKSFAALDEYLAHLEVKGHTDRPFWELMEDGRYRWNTGRGMQFKEPKYATREELLEKYGFSE